MIFWLPDKMITYSSSELFRAAASNENRKKKRIDI